MGALNRALPFTILAQDVMVTVGREGSGQDGSSGQGLHALRRYALRCANCLPVRASMPRTSASSAEHSASSFVTGRGP